MSFLYRQDVVYVVTGRYSRSAKFATSSELLYVVQLLPSECCDEYNTYTTLSEEFRVVFRFTHTSTFELISNRTQIVDVLETDKELAARVVQGLQKG